jgi:hypothetical protein
MAGRIRQQPRRDLGAVGAVGTLIRPGTFTYSPDRHPSVACDL